MKSIRKQHLASLLLIVLTALGCVGCGPEDGRARGGGPGGDAGNKPASVVPGSKVFGATQP
jgi:hypothetical protein